MKKFLLLISLIFFNLLLFAQYTVRIIVTDIATKKQENIYVAGNFNNWNPGETDYKMKPFGTRKLYALKNVTADNYTFKFTRGSWDKAETTSTGEDIPNHEVEVSSDTTVNFSITGWHDDFPDKPKPNTASMQVHILDTAFFIPQLNRYRRIWIYLPASYHQQKAKYFPVLYMHDGQNLFNEQTAPFGEWGVDECLDTLQQQLKKECIVVGIDNSGEHRLTEYNPYDNEKFGKGEGNQYVDFLVKTLKPFIDANYRTLKDAGHTSVAGSSMGGLISLYAVIKYPEVFGSAGVFSPAFWVTPQLYNDVQQAKWKSKHRFFFYSGSKESETMVSDMKRMEGSFNKDNSVDAREMIYPLGQHKEKYWRMQFDDFYRWLMK